MLYWHPSYSIKSTLRFAEEGTRQCPINSLKCKVGMKDTVVFCNKIKSTYKIISFVIKKITIIQNGVKPEKNTDL